MAFVSFACSILSRMKHWTAISATAASLARASRNVVISFLSGCSSVSNGGNADLPRVRCDHGSLAHACSALRAVLPFDFAKIASHSGTTG